MTAQQLVRDLTQFSTNGQESDGDADQLAEILADYMERLERGEPSNTEAILDAHPELADELRDNFAKLAALHRAAVGMTDGGETLDQLCLASLNQPHALGDFRLVRPIGRGGMGVVYEAEQISLHRRVALKTLPLAAVLDPKQLARFQNEAQAAASLDHPHIVSVYAVGADRGVHYYAMRYIEGLSLAEVVEGLKPRSDERGVAGKETPAEDQAATHVDTDITVPDTLPAVPADAVETLPYGADAWPPAHSVAGQASETQRGLSATLSTFPAFSSREYFRSIAQLGNQAAEALHYAHEVGVVHRDVKPSNLLLDNDGRLYVTDFGLAMTQSDSNLTMTGDLLGTLRYMSPEQASGRRALVDRRTDIYSLGASLYELATLQPAYPEEDRTRLLQQIISEPPQLPSRINKSLPADLETIVLKAMAKEPTDRYATAQDLADDLARFVKCEPIRARRTSQFERVRSWCRRNKLVASLLTAVATLLLAFAVGGPLAAVNQARLKWQAQEELSAKNINQLYQDWYSGNAQRVADELTRHAATADPDEPRFEWDLLRQIYADNRKSIIFERHGERDFPKFAAFSPDGRWLACGQPGDRVAIYDMRRKTFRQLDNEPPVGAAAVAFSLDGKELITLSWAGFINRRDVATGRVIGPVINCRPPGDSGTEDVVTWWNRFRLSPDGRTAAVGMANGELVLARLADGHTTRIAAHEGEVGAMAFTPDGSELVTSGPDRMMKVWNLKRGEMSRSLNAGWNVWGAQFTPDGRRLFLCGNQRGVQILDFASFAELFPLRTEPKAVSDLIVYDDDILATSGWDGQISLWDLASGLRLATLIGHFGRARAMALSPDGKSLVSADPEGSIRLWSLDPLIREARERLASSQAWTTDLHFVDGGQQLVSCTRPYFAPIGSTAAMFVRQWNVATGVSNTIVEQGKFGRSDLEPIPGTQNFLCGGPGKLSLVDTSSGSDVRILDEDPAHEYQHVAVSPDGKWVAGGGHLLDRPRETDYFALKPFGATCFVTIFNLESERHEFFRLATTESNTWIINRMSFSPDGNTLIAGGGDGSALYRVDTFQHTGARYEHVGIREIPRGRSSGEVADLAFSADGRVVGVAAAKGFGRIWAVDGTQQESLIRRKFNTYALAFSADGKILALGTASEIQLCDRQSQHPLATIPIGSRVTDLVFSPDDRTLAWAAADGRVGFLRTQPEDSPPTPLTTVAFPMIE